ncbi:hypothetical protein KsCSTR_22570 [Candidatus Kuenenia stuttgartiensis]|uniref:Uncharacterized protein n=1 Tax=Kuenenia stuttgartiensis TaxID=174633 RepID=Q1Q3D9_KUEST|nr:hypothetical protein KsCSTR_22570 [Candidatus Kuenenia stuttgartiensis]CAJ74531.1 unknown protein [Candidatus Kuenenia stuttgartiensis]
MRSLLSACNKNPTFVALTIYIDGLCRSLCSPTLPNASLPQLVSPAFFQLSLTPLSIALFADTTMTLFPPPCILPFGKFTTNCLSDL